MDSEASSDIVSNVNPEIAEQMTLEHEETVISPPTHELNIHVQALIKEIETFLNAEEKLNKIISFMESALAQEGTPHFKSFWESRNLCIPLFKEHLSPPSRATLWEKYSALSKEARRLKELLNEQSAFAEEQIDIAIKALEEDLQKSPSEHPLSQLSISCETLQSNVNVYNKLQKELSILNVFAAKINSLRKELIKTEMRIRKKNKFFQRLSDAGDKVFPQRKELIKEISQLFYTDVETFIQKHFSRDFDKETPYVLREEIKLLQNIAKILTLNAQTFNHTRTRLSECWDKLKEIDKERKNKRAEKKQLFQKNKEEIENKIKALETELNSYSNQEILEKIDSIFIYMRQVELGKEEVKSLRDHLHLIKQPIQEKIEKEAEARQEQEKERTKQKQLKFLELKDEVETLLRAADSYDLDKLLTSRESLLLKITQSSLVKMEKIELENLLKGLRDIITDKKEKKLFLLSKDAKQDLDQLNDILKQRKALREEAKNQIESLRKICGTSGLDFVKAMEYQAQLNEEKERLQKMNLAIKDIEQKIESLEFS